MIYKLDEEKDIKGNTVSPFPSSKYLNIREKEQWFLYDVNNFRSRSAGYDMFVSAQGLSVLKKDKLDFLHIKFIFWALPC